MGKEVSKLNSILEGLNEELAKRYSAVEIGNRATEFCEGDPSDIYKLSMFYFLENLEFTKSYVQQAISQIECNESK